MGDREELDLEGTGGDRLPVADGDELGAVAGPVVAKPVGGETDRQGAAVDGTAQERSQEGDGSDVVCVSTTPRTPSLRSVM